MYHSNGLEYIVSASRSYGPQPVYMARHNSSEYLPIQSHIASPEYQKVRVEPSLYSQPRQNNNSYDFASHFTPNSFLKQNRPTPSFVVDKREIMGFF